MSLFNELANDNRNYNYPAQSQMNRPEYGTIIKLVPEASRVIDLGCGDGSLLRYLTDEKRIVGTGLERSETGVQAAKAKGLSAHCQPIDIELSQFKKNQFDIAISNVTLQMLMYPEILLQEMARIAPRQIISFPNFASYKNRLDLLFNGRMPRPLLYGYSWYSTGHIHQLSLRDFYELADAVGLKVKHLHFLQKSSIKRALIRAFPNLFGDVFILETESRDI